MTRIERTESNVLPRSAGNDVGNSRFVDAVLAGERGSANTGCVSCSNGQNVGLREFGVSVPFAPRGAFGVIHQSLSALLCHVAHVVVMGSKEQMVRVHACRIVAAMKDPKPIRDWAIMNDPTRAVGTNNGVAIALDLTVPTLEGSGPYPALAGFVDMLPKTICHRDAAGFVQTRSAAKQRLTFFNRLSRSKKWCAAYSTDARDATMTGHLTNLLTGWWGAVTRSAPTLPGFPLPSFYHGGSYAAH